jgi:hypothetical protein
VGGRRNQPLAKVHEEPLFMFGALMIVDVRVRSDPDPGLTRGAGGTAEMPAVHSVAAKEAMPDSKRCTWFDRSSPAEDVLFDIIRMDTPDPPVPIMLSMGSPANAVQC